MPVCDECKPKWVNGFVKAYEQDMQGGKAFLGFTLYSGGRDEIKDYPFLQTRGWR
jgi:hypothetical protein